MFKTKKKYEFEGKHMNYRYLGKTGLKVSEICLGTMQFGWTTDEETSHKVMDKAYDAGMLFWDTANVYSRWSENSYAGKTEEIIGRWFNKTGHRDQIILASKVRGMMGNGPNDEGLSRRHIKQQIEASLKRLQTSWIDLYQTHRVDYNVPIEETLTALNDLIHQNKVHTIGASNYPTWALTESWWVAKSLGIEPYKTFQPYYNIIDRKPFEEETQLVCEKYGLGVIPYSPLAAGFLTGKYKKDGSIPESGRADGVKKRFMNEKGFKILDGIIEVANKHGVKPTQITLAWTLSQKTISSPIIGANTVEQLEDIIETSNVTLQKDDLKMLNTLSEWREIN